MKLDKTQIKKIGISLYACVAFVYMMCRFSVENMANSSMFILIAAIAIFGFIYKNIEKKAECTNDGLVWLMSFLFSIAIVTGCHFTNALIFSKMAFVDLLMYVFSIGGLIALFHCLFVKAYHFFENWAKKENMIERKPLKSKWKSWLLAFVMIMAGWIVVWLAYYPGLWNYDPYQVYQVMTGNYTKYHPLVHTLMLGWCYVYGLYQGNANIGVILYDFIQMSIMAGIFSYAYVYVKEHISNKWFHAGVLLFFAVFPVHSIMAISTTKDTIFSGLVLLGIILVYRIFENKEVSHKIRSIFLLVVIVLMMLFRNNAMYAFLVSIVFAVILFAFKKVNLKIVLFMLVCVVAYKSCDIALAKSLQAVDGPVGEMLCVTSQQFGRIYNLADEIGDEESKQMIEQFYQMDAALYNPYLTDTMKSQLKNVDDTEGMLEYFKTALKLFMRYPVVSVESFIYLTQGYWDVNDTSHADIYGFYGLVGYRFGYIMTTVFEGYGITRDSKLPELEMFLERAFTDNEYQNIPLISLIFAPATYLWFLMFCTIVMIKNKEWGHLMVYSFLWGYMLTLFLGPCVLIRYVYLLVVSLPIMICTLLNSISNKQMEEKNG